MIINSRFFLLLGAVLILIIITAYFFYGLQPNSEEGDKVVRFKITKGEGLKEISARLSQEKLIKSITVFKLYSLLSGQAQKFQPGVYDVSAAMSVPSLVQALTSFGKNELSVTIPEGLTIKDIDELLATEGIIEEGALINFSFEELKDDYEYLAEVSSLEGFLFPDTYRFELASETEAVVRRFLDNFKEKAWPILKAEKNWYDFLTLASYLEREVPGFSDRQVVAGILLKRLRLGIPLQVDATISYLKCGGKFQGCKNIAVLKEDLLLSSPYNTYQRLGWTPTPISNPGESALRAAVLPEATPYFYYLSAKGSGKTIFSRTLEEHNENRAKFL